MPLPKASRLGILGFLLLLAFLEFRLVLHLQDHNFEGILRAHSGILEGHPYWRAFQNRLLGAASLRLVEVLTGLSPAASLKALFLLLIALQNVVCYAVFRALTGSASRAMGYTLAFVGLFTALQDESWLFAWDLFDLTILFLFSFWVVTGKPLRFFVLLFLVALANRESALFVALWMILDGIFRPEGRARFARMGAGTVLLVGGIAAIAWIRERFFISSSVPEIGRDLAHRGLGNHLTLGRNLDILRDEVIHLRLDIAALFLVVYVVWFAVHERRHFTRRTLPLLLVLLGMVASVFCFGLIDETRHWLSVIPLLLVLHYAAGTEGERGRADEAGASGRA